MFFFVGEIDQGQQFANSLNKALAPKEPIALSLMALRSCRCQFSV